MPPKKRRLSKRSEPESSPPPLPEPKRTPAVDVARLQEYISTQQKDSGRMAKLREFAESHPDMGLTYEELTQLVRGVDLYRAADRQLSVHYLNLCSAVRDIDQLASVYQTIEARMRVYFEYAEIEGDNRANFFFEPKAWEKKGDEMYVTDIVSYQADVQRWYSGLYSGCVGCDATDVEYRLRTTFVFACSKCFQEATGKDFGKFRFKNLDKMPDFVVSVTPNYQDVLALGAD